MSVGLMSINQVSVDLMSVGLMSINQVSVDLMSVGLNIILTIGHLTKYLLA